MEPAARAGDFLVRLVENQPKSNLLYMVVRDGDEVVSEEAVSGDERCYIFHVGRDGQFYAPPAVAALFLAKLSEATGNEDYLSAAQLYLNFPETGGSDKYTSISSGFFGWAAAELYALTGSRNYMQIATNVADALLANQLENGSWLQASMSADLESDVVDGTAENIIVLRGITRALAVGAP
ncbi:MAG: hypothetical protein H5T86_07985 [Armatimonadetes bacterium]|nr:hypothetical protein [Armatimonadota bacterium]